MDIHPKATNPESLCGTCAAFDEANGECRRGHPTETSGDGYGIWPKVSAAIDWCLRWLPADEFGQAKEVPPPPQVHISGGAIPFPATGGDTASATP